MDPQLPVLEWARTASFSQPIRWGEVEAKVLASEPLPPVRIGLRAYLYGAIGWFVVLVLAPFTVAAPALGLVLVVVGATRESAQAAHDWHSAARAAFMLAFLVQVLTPTAWRQGRRRADLFLALVGGLAVVCSAAAYAVLLATTEPGGVPWLRLVVLAPGVVAAGFLIVMATRSTKPSTRKPPRRGPRDSKTRSRYKATRSEVVEILEKRRVVVLDGADRQRMNEMPLGYWEELDDVDEAERRRILEYRLVGWREFDESDERPWTRPRR